MKKLLLVIMLAVPGCAFAQSGSYQTLQTTLTSVWDNSIQEGSNASFQDLGTAVALYQQALSERYLALIERTRALLNTLEDESELNQDTYDAVNDLEQYITTSTFAQLEGLSPQEIREALSERRRILLEVTMRLRGEIATL